MKEERERERESKAATIIIHGNNLFVYTTQSEFQEVGCLSIHN